MADIVVVVPAYRAAPVIGAALASVAAQSLPPTEVVVVDDGSDDGTADAARRFSSVLPLLVVSQPNAGPAAARRRAIADSTSPLVALLDADDMWLPDHLASLVATHRRTGGIITADAIPWRPGGTLSLRTRRSQFAIPGPERQPLEILRDNFVFIGSLFSRASYLSAGGFRDGFTGAEDWDLWIRMIRTGVFVHAGHGQPTVLYRLVPGSLTRTASIYDRYLAVLDAARPGCRTDEERSVIDQRLRWLRARKALTLAYGEAERGSPAAARRLAREALHTSARMTTQALGLMLAPKAAAAVVNRAKTRITR